MVAGWVLYPVLSAVGRSVGRTGMQGVASPPAQSAFMQYAAHFPGCGQAFGGTVEVVRCSTYAIACQPGTVSREGDKSVEAVPLRMVDVQHALQSAGGRL